jgi:DNA-binding response OmpR family regulator
MNKTRILIVEDRPDFQNIFIKIVNRLKFEYQVAASLEQSIELLQRYSFHIALVDLSLDDKDTNNRDGFKVLDLIKKLNEGTESIILTAYGKSRDADKIIFGKYGLFGFIDKADMDISDVTNRIKAAAEKANLEMYKPSKLFQSMENIIPNQHLAWMIKSIKGENVDITETKIAELETFLKRLLVDFTPLLPNKKEKRGVIVPLEKGLPTIKTQYWSKALGCAVEMWVGNYETMHAITQPVNEAIYIKRAGYERRIKEVLEKTEFPDYGGALYKLEKAKFDEFEISPQIFSGVSS